MTADVVETYVPLMRNDTFMGALEIYYDITVRKDQLDNLLYRSLATLTILAGGLLSVIMFVLFKENRTSTERKLIEEELRNSENKYRALINDASDAILVSDVKGNILEANRRAEELIGYSKEELMQKRYTDLHPEDALDEATSAFRETVQAGSCSLSDGVILRKDGRIVPVDITASAIELGDQRVVQGLFRDITGRKRTEEIVRNIAEGVSASTGEVFFQSLVQHLAKVLGMDHAFVGELVDPKEELVETTAVWAYNKIADNFTYKLAHTPCENVVDKDLASYPHSVQEQFPLDDLLKDMAVECYVGVPLFHSAGHALGVMAVLDSKPLSNPQLAESALRVFATRASAELQRKRAEDELRKSEKELRFLSTELLNAQENERARVARELHDGIGQALSTLKVRVETLAKIARADVSRMRVEDLEDIVPVIRQTIEEVRDTSMNLRPSTLDSLGILPTIDWFCREHQTTYPFMQIEKKIDIRETDVPDPLRIVIYRIVQEALNNAARHSGAETMRISLAKTDGKITLAVQDNGQGFDLEDLLSADTAERGFGLTSMKERTELSGGSFSIESALGEGTTVRANWKV